MSEAREAGARWVTLASNQIGKFDTASSRAKAYKLTSMFEADAVNNFEPESSVVLANWSCFGKRRKHLQWIETAQLNR
jgi:hypothetical protein